MSFGTTILQDDNVHIASIKNYDHVLWVILVSSSNLYVSFLQLLKLKNKNILCMYETLK